LARSGVNDSPMGNLRTLCPKNCKWHAAFDERSVSAAQRRVSATFCRRGEVGAPRAALSAAVGTSRISDSA
jgi:hypothetical protein